MASCSAWRNGVARAVRTGMAAALALALAIGPMPIAPADAANTRSLSFKQMHTGETQTITYKRNGRYDSSGLRKINYMLRDWRRNESTKIDPRLLDLIWDVKQAVGSRGPVHVLSGYRSPVTNAMLRRRGRGVAKKSQHTLGKALDFYLPDVPLRKVRETAMRMQRGGVGFYPKSGSPFVHLDVGNVRAWPRMTRNQLIALFPNGETLHLPSDGSPLPGYQRAKAKASRGQLAIASVSSRGADDNEDSAAIVVGSRRDAASAITIGGNRNTRQRDTAPVAVAAAPQANAGESWTPPSSVPLPRHNPNGASTQIAGNTAIPTPPLRGGVSDTQVLATASIPMPRRRPLISDAVGAGAGTQVAAAIASETDQLSALARAAPGGLMADPLSGPDARLQLAAALAERAEKMSSDRTIGQLVGGSSVFAGSSFSIMEHPTRDNMHALMSLHHPVLTGSFAGPVVVYARQNGFSGPAIVSVSARQVGFPRRAGTLSTASLQ